MQTREIRPHLRKRGVSEGRFPLKHPLKGRAIHPHGPREHAHVELPLEHALRVRFQNLLPKPPIPRPRAHVASGLPPSVLEPTPWPVGRPPRSEGWRGSCLLGVWVSVRAAPGGGRMESEGGGVMLWEDVPEDRGAQKAIQQEEQGGGSGQLECLEGAGRGGKGGGVGSWRPTRGPL